MEGKTTRWSQTKRHGVSIRSEMGDYIVYMLGCSDETIYTGQTNSMSRRWREHCNKNAARYTAKPDRHPLSLIHVERFDTRSAAMSREYEIKQLTHDQKVELASESENPQSIVE